MKTWYRKLKDLHEGYQPKCVSWTNYWFVDGACGYCATSKLHPTREQACREVYKKIKAIQKVADSFKATWYFTCTKEIKYER